jgi:hypothetical protein
MSLITQSLYMVDYSGVDYSMPSDPPLLLRSHKRDCVNCDLRHSSTESVVSSYCNKCKNAMITVLSWYRRCVRLRRFVRGVLVLNVLSRRIGVGELGICDNIMIFL